MMKYVLGIDQSTQGTKAILLDARGRMVEKMALPHKQIVNEQGWVSHDPEEIYRQTLEVSRRVIVKSGIKPQELGAVGISNQRESTAVWNKQGQPLDNIIVWQCARAKEITSRLQDKAELVQQKTGLKLSPYFPAAKMAWFIQHSEKLKTVPQSEWHFGTVDAWLIYKLTSGESFKTDYSNASRTQLFNIHTLQWDEELCNLFGVPKECLPEVVDSDANFGYTTLGGYLDEPIPIHAALGDSHAALFGQGCTEPGMIKTTYGTGSSIMMNTGEKCCASENGLVTSIAWAQQGKVDYVLEGNINYTGAVISWLKDNVQLIESPEETAELAEKAEKSDQTVLVPAFSGLSAPYWNNDVQAMLCHMSRTTGKNEIVRAALNSIALQIQAVLDAMRKDSQQAIAELRVDGGPTHNPYLMQFQSDLSDTQVSVAGLAEVSALGAAYMAGLAAGICEDNLFQKEKRKLYQPQMAEAERRKIWKNWQTAIDMLLTSQTQGKNGGAL